MYVIGVTQKLALRRRQLLLCALALTAAMTAGAGPSAAAAPGGSTDARAARTASHTAFVATATVGRYKLLLMATQKTLIASQPPGQLLVELIRSSAGAAGSEVDSYLFHLKAGSVTVSGSSVRLSTGKQLGHFGAISLRMSASRVNVSVGCGGRIAGARGGSATGTLRFKPGGSYFGTISRRSLTGALVTVSFTSIASACHGAQPSLPSTQPTSCPPSPELLLTAVGASSPESILVVSQSGGSSHLALTVLQDSAPASFIAHELLASLPATDWTASSGSSQLSVSGGSPFGGSLSFTGVSLPGALSGCGDYEGAASGSLTASFDTVGTVSLATASGLLIG